MGQDKVLSWLVCTEKDTVRISLGDCLFTQHSSCWKLYFILPLKTVQAKVKPLCFGPHPPTPIFSPLSYSPFLPLHRFFAIFCCKHGSGYSAVHDSRCFSVLFPIRVQTFGHIRWYQISHFSVVVIKLSWPLARQWFKYSFYALGWRRHCQTKIKLANKF